MIVLLCNYKKKKKNDWNKKVHFSYQDKNSKTDVKNGRLLFFLIAHFCIYQQIAVSSFKYLLVFGWGYTSLVQLTVRGHVHISVSGLPVLTMLYKLIPMNKRTKSQNFEFCFFIKVVALKKANFHIFLPFGQFHQKSGLIGRKQN